MIAQSQYSELAVFVRSKVLARREQIVELCREAVSSNSVNPPGDTRGVASSVKSFLEARDIASEFFSVDELMPSVVAKVDSTKPGKHLLFNAHLDTMPPGELTLWSVPPFELTRKDGRLYGLGMGNMKGAVVAMSHALDILNELRDHWTGEVTFAAVSDEVVFGPHGAEALINLNGLTGDALICGEGPGFRRTSNGEKGVLWVRIQVTASPGHSSAVTAGTSASAIIAKVITQVDSMNGWQPGESFSNFRSLVSPVEASSRGRERILTANIGRVAAGSFIGQIATTGEIEIDFRIPPGLLIETVIAELERLLAEAKLTTTVSIIKGWEPNVTEVSSKIVDSWSRATASLDLPAPEFAIRLPASDASRWRRLGVPAICYGPQPLLSSGVDDYAEEDEVLNCVMLYVMSALDFLS